MQKFFSKGQRLFSVLLILYFVSFSYDVIAAVNLSVNPLEGGTTLRLGRVGSSDLTDKVVKFRISSSDNVQYQVFQRLVEPLVNEQGASLNSDALKTYTIVGSNAQGTLYVQNLESLTQTEQLLYTSPADGLSDGFDIAYAVRPERMNATGQFVGRIMYTLRSLGSGSQDQVILTVTLDAQGELKTEVSTSTGANVLRLTSKNTQAKQEHVKIAIKDNLSGTIKIYQELETAPQNELFEEIDTDVLEFSLASEGTGQKFAQLKELNRRQELLYETQGQSDTLYVNWELEPLLIDKQKAGKYTGRLKYTIESSNAKTEEIFVNLEIQVDPQFNIEVTLPLEGMRFEKVLPDSPAQVKEVFVQVKTNLGKPYMVMQNVLTPLTNTKGNEIVQEHFHIKVTLEPGGKGRVAFSDFSEVKSGDSSIFYSDNQGSPASFRAYYRLRGYPEIPAGDYSTAIVYSLSEM